MQFCRSLSIFSLIAAVAAGANVKNIVVFGDSNSDVGNAQRWSNGPLWSEYLAAAWNSSLYSFAYSGAVCDSGKYKTTGGDNKAVSLRDQLEAYHNLNLNLEPAETVYAFWFGPQDVYEIGRGKQEPEYKGIVDCIGQQMRAARKVFLSDRYLVLNVPPLGSMPFYRDTEAAVNKSQAAIDINRGLEKDVANLNKHHHALEMDYVDIHTLVNDITINPSIFGFKNPNASYLDECYAQNECLNNEKDYIWWDQTHFTTSFHKVIARSIVEAESYMPGARISPYLEKELENPKSRFHSQKYVVEPYKGTFDEQARLYDLQKLQPTKPQQPPLDDGTKSLYDTTYENSNVTETHEKRTPAWIFIMALLIIGSVACIKYKKVGLFSHCRRVYQRGKFVPVRNEDV